MPLLERFTKRAAVVSVMLIAVLQIAFHPGMTGSLQVLSVAAVLAGWFGARQSRETMHALWLVAAPLAPAVLRQWTTREGPVLDVFWMAGLTASLMRSSAWSRWELPPASRLFAGAWALTLSLVWPVLAARELGFDVRTVWDTGAMSSWSMLPAPYAAAWILFVVWTQLLGVLWLDWLAGRFTAAAPGTPGVVHGVWIGATLASVVAIYQGTVDLGFASTPYWAGWARATGGVLDANAYGMCAALAAAVAFVLLRSHPSQVRTIASWSILAINLAGVWLSGSRTAALCGLIGAACVASILRRPHARPRRTALITGVAAAALVAAIVLAIAVTGVASGPVARLFERPANTGVVETLVYRPPYGTIAARMTRDHPLTGVGPGSFQILAPDYWRQMSTDPYRFDTAQNWWRHQAAELGLLGGAPLLLWSALIAWRVATRAARPDRASEARLVRGLLAAVGIASLVQVPTQAPLVLLWFFLLVAWLDAVTREEHLLRPGWPWAVAAAVAVAFAAGQALLARGPLAVDERAARQGREYVAGAHGEERLGDGTPFRWTDDRSRFLWPASTRWLVIRVWAHHPDLEQNPVRARIAAGCATLLDERIDNRGTKRIGVMLPEGQTAVDAMVLVSRTWRPAAYGGSDPRELGVGIAANFVANSDALRGSDTIVELRPCDGGA